MSKVILLDTGPLVAYLKNQDNWHNWTLQQLAKISCPLLSNVQNYMMIVLCLPLILILPFIVKGDDSLCNS